MITIQELERMVAADSGAAADESGGVGDAVDLCSAVDAYILSCQANGLSDTTVRWYRSLLMAFANEHNCWPLRGVGVHLIRLYIVNLRRRDVLFENAPQRPAKKGGLSESTIAGHITALHAFWAWCSKEYSIMNPMQNIKRARRQIKPPSAVQPADFVKLFNACGEGTEASYRDRAVLAMFADTGVRLAGLVGLKVSDIDFPNLRAVVTEKGNKTRTVVFTKYTRALLGQWLDQRRANSPYVFTSLTTGEPITSSGIELLMNRLKKRAGITGRVNPHSFRHAFAREYIRSGGDPITLARLIGHSDVNTTAAYYAVFTTDELAELHAKHSPLLRLMERGA